MKTVYDEFKDMVRFNEEGEKNIKFDIFDISKRIYFDIHDQKTYSYMISTKGWHKYLAFYSYDLYENAQDLIDNVAYEMRNYFEEYGIRLENDLINGYRR